jgi:maintenance of morphology protein 1
MAGSSILSLEPTFTQGLIIGQFSIICLLILVLRHLFFDSQAGRRLDTPTYHPRLEREEALHATASEKSPSPVIDGGESAEWFSLILQNVCLMFALRFIGSVPEESAQVIETYRSKYRDDLDGSEGDEVVRGKIEELVNRLRPERLLVSHIF